MFLLNFLSVELMFNGGCMEIYTKFSEILKDLIEEKGLSLRKLAVESNVSAVQYSKYMRGSCPTIDVAVRIADYFDCSLDYLFGLTENMTHKDFKHYDMTVFIPRYLNLLKENQITHWKFYQKYGMNESSIRHWKRGEVPRIENLMIIAYNLSSSIDYLVGRSDEK